MEYDKLKPHIIIEKSFSFKFNPNRFEVWAKGQLASSGTITGELQCIPVFFDDRKSEIKTVGFPPELNLRDTLIFDLTFTGSDRIFLATVPEKTNIDNNDSFQGFKTLVPLGFPIITRKEREFAENEPYVCSIFQIKEVITKISFSFGNNSRLLELYYDREQKISSKEEKIAQPLVELLIDDWDDDGAWVDEDNVKYKVEKMFGFSPAEQDLIKTVQFINSKFDRQIIVREINDMGFSRSMVYKTSFSKTDLRTILRHVSS